MKVETQEMVNISEAIFQFIVKEFTDLALNKGYMPTCSELCLAENNGYIRHIE